MFYDALLITALWMMVGGLLVFANGNQVIRLPILPILLPLVTFIFFVQFWRTNGQTLGMQTWRIKIIDQQGGKVSFKQCLMRFAGAALSWFCLGLGYWWILWDKEERAWHDRLSGTRIVFLPKPARTS